MVVPRLLLPRSALVAPFLLLSLSLSRPAAAGGAVLTPLEDPALSVVDVRMAIAVTPTGSTRWSELSLPAKTRALWLVPVRPGAAVDWVSSRWLDALDEATRPRIAPPSAAADCPMRTNPEEPPSWTFVTPNQHASSGTVELSADAVLSYATAHGYRTSPALRDALVGLYAEGWRVLRHDVAADAQATAFGTIRVTDDGGAILPLALSSGMRLTTFTIGQGRSALATNGQEIARDDITWGLLASNYSVLRHDILSSLSEAWIRETYSHGVLFDSTPVGTSVTRSIASAYFLDAACAQAAGLLRSSTSPLDPSTVSCGEQTDFGVALSGTAPANAIVTRWVSSIPAKAFGSSAAIEFQATIGSRGPVLSAGAYEPCADAPSQPSSGGGSYSAGSGSSSGSGSGSGDDDDGSYVVVSEGCGSSSSTVSTNDPPPSDSSSDGCSGSDDSSGWDSSDDSGSDGWDSDDSDDSCSKKDDSSSSDSCSSSSPKKSGSDDGWDTEDQASPKAHARVRAAQPHRKKSSPASRYALLGVAILLPFRRRARPSASDAGPT